MAEQVKYLTLLIATAFVSGCATAPRSGDVATESASIPADDQLVRLIDYEDSTAAELIQPPAVAERADASPGITRLPTPSAEGLTLKSLEEIALSGNPAISQAAARVRALQGKWVQVGLAPNPTTGYTASEIGDQGAAGQQGGFVGQQFITAHKLRRNRAVVAAEISRAEQQLAAMQRKVLTDVRQAYYEALIAQRRVELADVLVRLTAEAVEASQSLVEAEEIAIAGLLQTEVGLQNARIIQRTSTNKLEQSWRRLSAVTGERQLAVQPLQGDVTQIPETLDWDEQLVRLESESPEIADAMAEVARARRALNRASVEAVPNVATQVSVQYDDFTKDTIAGVQIGLPLPIWNRNQGGIRQAQAEVTEAVRSLDRVALDLNQRLADAFREYSDAYVAAQTYSTDILPRSDRTLSLVQAAYTQGEIGYLDLLAAQRTFSQTNLAYLDSLESLWKSTALIEGLLLQGSLSQDESSP